MWRLTDRSRGGARTAALVLFFVVLGLVDARAGAAQCAATWTTVSSPNVGQANFLNGVGGSSPSDVWAVGHWVDDVNRSSTLIEHWDGATWQKVPSPNLGSPPNGQLESVVALSPSNAWAVGWYSENAGTGPPRQLILHWDGAQWASVAGPLAGESSYLLGVAATGPADMWAVGVYNDSAGVHTLVEHWNGVGWTVVPSPDRSGALLGVAALAPNDAWAVGQYSSGPPGQPNSRTLSIHWDGAQWSVVPTPNVVVNGSEVSTRLDAVTAVGPSLVWAVGTHVPGLYAQPVIQRWDGSSWGIVAHGATPQSAHLMGIGAGGPHDAWAVGHGLAEGTSQNRPLVQRWDGSAWETVSSGGIGLGRSFLMDVAALAGGHYWAVGYQGSYSTLTARYCSPPPQPAPPPPPPPRPPPPPPPPPLVPGPPSAAPRCVVPNVRNRTLVAARRAIAARRCRVGRVRRARSTRVRRGRVVSQRPRAGSRVRLRSRVDLVVSRGRRG
jgi:hypothetical protein